MDLSLLNILTNLFFLTEKIIKQLPMIGKMYTMHLAGESKVMFDGNKLIVIELDPTVLSNGMCGNNDGIKDNDRLTKSGVIGTTNEIAQFQRIRTLR